MIVYNKNYLYLTEALAVSKFINVPQIDPRERMAPDSIQFNLSNFNSNEVKMFMHEVRKQGVSLYVFGIHEDNARVFWNWRYLKNLPPLPKTKNMLEVACDMRLPVFFRKPHLDYIIKVIFATLREIKKSV